MDLDRVQQDYGSCLYTENLGYAQVASVQILSDFPFSTGVY